MSLVLVRPRKSRRVLVSLEAAEEAVTQAATGPAKVGRLVAFSDESPFKGAFRRTMNWKPRAAAMRRGPRRPVERLEEAEKIKAYLRKNGVSKCPAAAAYGVLKIDGDT